MGFLALILHAHLPFVRHPEHEHFLEEDWFFEAVTETYIPLLRMMHRLVDDSVPFKLTMSLTPTLCAMLQDQLLRERYVRHLDNLIDLAAREQQRNRKHPQLRELADFYFNLFSETRRVFIDEWKGDLLSIFRELRETGAIEIIASAATHGLLPIVQQQSIQAARFSTLTACYLENRVRAGQFMRLALRQRGRRLLRATATQAGKSGAPGKVTREIQFIGNSIAISVSTFRCNIWVRSPEERENFPV